MEGESTSSLPARSAGRGDRTAGRKAVRAVGENFRSFWNHVVHKKGKVPGSVAQRPGELIWALTGDSPTGSQTVACV